jgi:hypothetical protein
MEFYVRHIRDKGWNIYNIVIVSSSSLATVVLTMYETHIKLYVGVCIYIYIYTYILHSYHAIMIRCHGGAKTV